MVGLQQQQANETDAERRKRAVEILYGLIRSANNRASSGWVRTGSNRKKTHYVRLLESDSFGHFRYHELLASLIVLRYRRWIRAKLIY